MSKFMLRLWVLLVIVAVLFVGCASDVTKETANGGDVYPNNTNSNTEPYEQPTIAVVVYTQEFKDRCRLTFAEGGIKSLEEQICLSAVPYNREKSPLFPKVNTFYEVLYDPDQFECVRNGEIYNEGKVVDFDIVPERTIEAVQRAMEGEDPTEQLLWDQAVKQGEDPEYYASGGALFFIGADYFYEAGLNEDITVFVHPEGFHHVFFKIWG